MTTKATSKAERKRKRRAITMPNAEPVAVRRGAGRPATEDATRTALEARVRLLGMVGAKDADSACRSPLAGCDIGRCLLSILPKAESHMPLWEVWQAMTAAQANYRVRILGTSGNPQGAAIAMVPEPMQTDQGHTVDIRSPDERDAAAKRANAYWEELLGRLPAPQFKWALRVALDEEAGALWRDAQPTPRGRVAVQALGMLRDMKEAHR